MIISKLLRLFIVITLIILLASCELLLPSPLGRDNPDDPDVQIVAFKAAVSGRDSIMTIWDWREANPEISESRIIDEIWIVHNVKNPPASRFPLDSDEVQKYKSRDTWNTDWTNLSSNEEHYFALYAKEKGGTWLAPKYTNIYLNSNGLMKSYSASPEPILYALEDNPFTQTVYPLDSSHWAIIRYNTDGSENGIIVNGNINVSIGVIAAPAGDVWIVPLRWRVPEGVSWDNVDNNFTMDMDNALKFYMNNTDLNFSIEITEILNLVRLYGSNTVALVPADVGGAGFNLNSIAINYYSWELE